MATKTTAVRMTKPRRVSMVLPYLEARYGDVECALLHDSPFQLLIATVLSAQCRDERVNIVARELFAQYGTAWELANADLSHVAGILKSLGLYKTKSKNIIALSTILCEKHNGTPPNNMTDLVALPGVGRKTANVLLGECFEVEGVVVDTHVNRITNRLGLTTSNNPVVIEKELMKLLPKNEWRNFTHRTIYFGREVCIARKPNCHDCGLQSICTYKP